MAQVVESVWEEQCPEFQPQYCEKKTKNLKFVGPWKTGFVSKSLLNWQQWHAPAVSVTGIEAARAESQLREPPGTNGEEVSNASLCLRSPWQGSTELWGSRRRPGGQSPEGRGAVFQLERDLQRRKLEVRDGLISELFLFFLGTQGLHIEPLHLLFFVMGFFQDMVSWTICLGWVQTVILLISASLVARITGMSHPRLAKLTFSLSKQVTLLSSYNWDDKQTQLNLTSFLLYFSLCRGHKDKAPGGGHQVQVLRPNSTPGVPGGRLPRLLQRTVCPAHPADP
jgi:hypothetical protein